MRNLIGVALLASVLLAGCASKDNGGTPAVATTGKPAVPGQVVVANIAFTPASIDVTHGQQVTWTFEDNNVPHSVTADAGAPAQFDSGQKTSGTFVFSFPNPGRYPYHCTVHARMHGTVVVS